MKKDDFLDNLLNQARVSSELLPVMKSHLSDLQLLKSSLHNIIRSKNSVVVFDLLPVQSYFNNLFAVISSCLVSFGGDSLVISFKSVHNGLGLYFSELDSSLISVVLSETILELFQFYYNSCLLAIAFLEYNIRIGLTYSDISLSGSIASNDIVMLDQFFSLFKTMYGVLEGRNYIGFFVFAKDYQVQLKSILFAIGPRISSYSVSLFEALYYFCFYDFSFVETLVNGIVYKGDLSSVSVNLYLLENMLCSCLDILTCFIATVKK